MKTLKTNNAAARGRLRQRAGIAKALGHPTRLFIVEELSRRERCVCELKEMIGADMSTVSRHLLVLKNAGILQDDKRGLQVYYSLKCPCILNFFKCIEAVIETNGRDRSAAGRSAGGRKAR